MATTAPYNLNEDALFRAFKNEFESKIREHLKQVVLHISTPIIEKAVREVVDSMQVAMHNNWKEYTTDFCVLIRDERTKRKE